MNRTDIKLILFQVILCFILNISISVFAENNTYEDNNIFKLDEEKSSVKEGENIINIDSIIKLVFTKNISDGEEIIELNKSLITIVDENENLIDIQVDIKDYNITQNYEDRNTIYVKPMDKLEIDKKYIIRIDENLQTNEEYLEKQFPINLNFTPTLDDENQGIEYENIIDKNTLIEKIKEALLLNYSIDIKELEDDKILITIINDKGIESTYIYIGTIEEVKNLIQELEIEMNKDKEPEQELKPEQKPQSKPDNKPIVPQKPEIKPDNYEDIDSNISYDNTEEEYVYEDDEVYNEDNIIYGEGYDEDILSNELDQDKEIQSIDDNYNDNESYEFNNNIGVALILCFFVASATYIIYFL